MCLITSKKMEDYSLWFVRAALTCDFAWLKGFNSLPSSTPKQTKRNICHFRHWHYVVWVCVLYERRGCEWFHWGYLERLWCLFRESAHKYSPTPHMHHLLPTFTKAATTRTNSETHLSKNTTMVNFGTLMHVTHRCPYQQQIGPLIHTPTYKHWHKH